ncbi:DUF6602 domain-containing protein [Metasolibacillus meyeri]|uniref:DUF6602 domain-containing protein n=1 Tax=Metasolibacillus meyeri TaxID=1071052 RepID=UPI000D301AB7|nr:DUF6602 domain-containing protein [Metasolibacillus meyeri]
MKKDGTKVINKLSENYLNLEGSIIAQLKIDKENTENIWLPVFKRIVPTKYNIETNVYIIDSYKTISPKVSIAIYDEQYTPYIFNYGVIKYIPIEAVFAVVLCGAQDLKESQEWLKEIQALKTDMNAYVRIQQGLVNNTVDKLYAELQNQIEKEPNKEPRKVTQTSTRPITILCATDETGQGKFDIVLQVQKIGDGEKLTKKVTNEEASLDYWYKQLNHYVNEERYDRDILDKLDKLAYKNEIPTERTLMELNVYKNGIKEEQQQNALLSLTFQLNQLLMLINNPIFFPHASYVKAFNGIGGNI